MADLRKACSKTVNTHLLVKFVLLSCLELVRNVVYVHYVAVTLLEFNDLHRFVFYYFAWARFQINFHTCQTAVNE